MNARHRKTEVKLQEQCDNWNAKHPVGTAVTLRHDNGTDVATATRSAAWVLSGHTAVIMVNGVTGCYLLDRVTPAAVQASAQKPTRLAEPKGPGWGHDFDEDCVCLDCGFDAAEWQHLRNHTHPDDRKNDPMPLCTHMGRPVSTYQR